MKSHYVDHKNKFNSFTVLVVCKMNGEVIDEIKLSSYVAMEKKYRLYNKILDGERGIRSCYEYINDCFFINEDYDEINIIFISDFQDITFYHCLNQPMSKLTRKLIINLSQNQSGDYTYKWLPNCFLYNYIPTDDKKICYYCHFNER